MPFTESSFARRSVPVEFRTEDIGIALIDLWNYGGGDSPVGETLGPELSFERGLSHARRKCRIIESKIAPAVDQLRRLGVQIFHCNHVALLRRYPEWLASTTEREREALDAPREPASNAGSEPPLPEGDWPPSDWVAGWRRQHDELVWGTRDWRERLDRELRPQMAIPAPVAPKPGDLLVYDREQFHRLLKERRIRALFFMGFEADQCIVFSPYGIANMQEAYYGCGYLCTVVRDCTTTFEVAETLEGLWRTHLAIDSIEGRFGYSITADALLEGIRNGTDSSR